jgi:hypothetical protein
VTDQPREPAGSPEGGQWTSSTGHGSAQFRGPLEKHGTGKREEKRLASILRHIHERPEEAKLEFSPQQAAFHAALSQAELDAVVTRYENVNGQHTEVSKGYTGSIGTSVMMNQLLHGELTPEVIARHPDPRRRAEITAQVPQLHEAARHMISAIDKADRAGVLAHQPALYRGVRATATELSHLVPGAEFTDKAFVSTSLHMTHAHTFTSKEDKALFKITTNHGGMFISTRMSNLGEAEVLLRPNLKFRVTHREKNPVVNGKKYRGTVIHLTVVK